LKRIFEQTLEESLEGLELEGPDKITWVITYPAIWKQPAQDLMRKAAADAKIQRHDAQDRILWLSEPEAAARHAIECTQQIPSIGEILMTSDLGGGTHDQSYNEIGAKIECFMNL